MSETHHHPHHHHDDQSLTKNQALVMDRLSNAGGPLSAYTILDQLRDQGFRAPLQVYRALDKLVEFGMVHRLESMNAFVACRHSSCDQHEAVAFAICETCGEVTEISGDALDGQLKALAAEVGFVLTKSTVELRGRCARCKTA